MTPTTLYYFFSTTAQVMAAISALLAIFTQFKMNGIKKFLLGDGKAIYERMLKKEEGFELEHHERYINRLKDALFRESITGILQILELLARAEHDNGKTIESNPRGLQYLEIRVRDRINQLKKIKLFTKMAIITSIVAIFLSLLFILFVEKMISNNCLIWESIVITLITSISSLIFTIQGVFFGLKDQEGV